MATVRHDVDAALDFYVGKLGFTLVQRWGQPFAIVSHSDLTLWLSGPGGRQLLRRGTAVESSFPSA